MATLHLMVGLPCSGKTTRAKILEKECGALLLTPDKWHVKLFGNDTLEAGHDGRHEIVEELQWEVARRVLVLGIDVILDFGFWGKSERIYFKNKAKELGAGFKIHYMNVPEEELYKRLEKRNRDLPEGTFEIPVEKMKEYVPLFQPVEKSELTDNTESAMVGEWHNKR